MPLAPGRPGHVANQPRSGLAGTRDLPSAGNSTAATNVYLVVRRSVQCQCSSDGWSEMHGTVTSHAGPPLFDLPLVRAQL